MTLTDAFESGNSLCRYCDQEGILMSEAMIRREAAMGEMTREEIIAEMNRNLLVMRESIRRGL